MCHLASICVGTCIGHAEDSSTSVMQGKIDFIFKFAAIYAFATFASACMLRGLMTAEPLMLHTWCIMIHSARDALSAECGVEACLHNTARAKATPHVVPVGSPAWTMKSLMIL